MDIMEAMRARHSVRRYTDRAIEEDPIAALAAEIEACNREGRLNMQLILNEPEAFDHVMAHYGKFRGVRNYIAIVGKDAPDLDERAGYYGERVVLRAAMLGLNTCWVVLTYGKRKSRRHIRIGEGERLVCVISLGYGETQGAPHKNKPMETLYRAGGEPPAWFLRGMEAAMLAPTATNQQRFCFTLIGSGVRAEATGGFCKMIDLGIVKYHFELGAGKENFKWA